jgi:putative hydrolase of the HAD superfamily
MHSFKAVAFDYGKVLSLPPTEEQWQALSTRFNQPMQEFQRIYWEHRVELDRGTLDNVAYWKRVGKDCGFEISDAEAEELIDRDNVHWTNENPEMLALSRELRKAGYKTAIMSNMEQRMLAAMRQKLNWLDEFEVQIYSSEVGTVKPEARIYLLCCERLDCNPEEVLFLDDKQPNTEGAKKVGMHAYIYQSAVDPVMLTGKSEITAEELRRMLLGSETGRAEANR